MLKNYVTYKTLFELSKIIEDDPDLNKKKAKRAVARFVSLHPHNIAQKTEIMIEHFHQITMNKIGGKAKAMVVTSSRAHVVKHNEDLFIRTLVARMGQNEEIFARIMDDEEFATQVKDVLMKSVYRRLNEPGTAEEAVV